MMNLKNLGKRFYFKIGWHLLVFTVLIVCTIISINTNEDYISTEKSKYLEYKLKQDSLLNIYKNKLDSMEIANLLLEKERLVLDRKIDSITFRQNELNVKYENEIMALRNASVADHNNWFYAKLDSIKKYYKQDWLDSYFNYY